MARLKERTFGLYSSMENKSSKVFRKLGAIHIYLIIIVIFL
jgi:hypothetical protein